MNDNRMAPVICSDASARVDSSGKLPRWCSLPVPGTTLIVGSTHDKQHEFFPIDKHRMYLVGGSESDHIRIAELGCTRFVLMHHRNGHVYVSSNRIDKFSNGIVSACTEKGNELVIGKEPVELLHDTPIIVHDVQLTVTRRVRTGALRECLRNFSSNDEQTRQNTILNMSDSLPSRKECFSSGKTRPLSCTPTSVKRKRRRRKDEGIGDDSGKNIEALKENPSVFRMMYPIPKNPVSAFSTGHVQSDRIEKVIRCNGEGLGELVKYIMSFQGSHVTQGEVIRIRKRGGKSHIAQLIRLLIDAGQIDFLMVDKFGNYFMQTLLTHADSESFNLLVKNVSSDRVRFSSLCIHPYASHVIQTIINKCKDNTGAAVELLQQLCAGLENLANHFLGSICLIHAIDSLPPNNQFTQSLAMSAQELSCSRHGHLVMIHALDIFGDDFCQLVETSILRNLDAFMRSEFGTRIVFHVLRVNNLSRAAFIGSLVELIKFNAQYFRMIEHLVVNYANHIQVRSKLIPKIVNIVHAGKIPRDQAVYQM